MTEDPLTSPAGGSFVPRQLASQLLLAALTFGAAFLWLRNGHLLLPQAGTQSVLAADALLEGRGLELDPGVPFSKYPPLYPLLLAPLEWCGLDVIPAVYALNAATLAATLCALLALARAMGLRGAALAPLIYLGLGATHYLLRAARGDAIPICMSLCLVLALTRYGRAGSKRALLAAALACAIAGLARYMALFTLIPIGLAGTLWLSGSFPRRRWRDSAVFALVAGIPPALWLLRNQLVKGFAFGIPKVSEARAGAEGTTFGNNLRGILDTLLVDLFGYDALGVIRVVHGDTPIPHVAAMWLGAGLACAGLLALALSLRGGAPPASHALPGEQGRSPREHARRLLSAYCLLYLVALVTIWTVGQNDPIHTRYVAPLYAPLLLLVLDLAQASRERGRAGWKTATLAGLAALVLVPNLQKSVRLLGESPEDRLIEITSRHGRGRWHRDLTWDLRGGGALED